MDTALREFVRLRADGRCEYCLFPEEFAAFIPYHIEHIIPRKHRGSDHPGNLALACHHCNSHKGPNLTGRDPQTKKVTKLYHPRRHDWATHFRWVGPVLEGRTAIGRTTVFVLLMNDPDAIRDREALMEEELFP